MAVDPVYGFELIDEGDGAAAVKSNMANRLLACGASHFIVKSEGDNSPPGGVVESDGIIVGASPTGAFTGHSGIALYVDGGWEFVAPREGDTAFVQDDELMRRFNGSAWQGGDTVNNLAGGADLPTTVTKVNDLLTALRKSCWIKGS